MTREEIRATVSMRDVLRKYGVSLHYDRCQCFLHNGKDYNMSIYKDKVAHCFVCNANADVFDVVMHFENCDFKSAMEILGGERPATLRERHRARQDVMRLNMIDNAQLAYDKALRLFCAADYIKSYYRQTKSPKAYPFYVYALQNMSRYEQALYESEVRLNELKSKYKGA